MSIGPLNWFQARDFAALGYAIRPLPMERWYVRRTIRNWYIYTVNAETGMWEAELAPAEKFTLAEFGRKDWVLDPWVDGARPPCARPEQPTELAPNSTGGLASWGVDPVCTVVEIPPGPTTPGTEEAPDPVLDFYALLVNHYGAVERVVEGFTRFPVGYVGGVVVSAVFRNDIASIPPSRCYTWVRPGAAVPSPVGGETVVFLGDGITALPPALGPVQMDRYGGGGTDAGFGAGGYVLGVAVAGLPGAVLLAVPMQPGTTLHARMAAVLFDGTQRTYTTTLTLDGWAIPPIVITLSVSPSPAPTGERHYYTGPGPDVTPGTEDDDFNRVVCYLSDPGTLTMTVYAVVTGGKAGSGTLRIWLGDDTVAAEEIIGRSGSATFEVPWVDEDGAYAVFNASFTQSADEYGPNQYGTGNSAYALPRLCASLPDSEEAPDP